MADGDLEMQGARPSAPWYQLILLAYIVIATETWKKTCLAFQKIISENVM